MGPLGHIRFDDRTPAQHAAHAAAVAAVKPLAHFGLPRLELKAGQSIRLFDAWKHPKVIADVGFKFDRFHQLTGSCVGAGGGNALFSTIAAQRLLAVNPTKAFLPFWMGPYAISRHLLGDDSQGEGSTGSTFAEALNTVGVRDWPSGGDNLPTYTDSDGVTVSGESVEMTWSSYRNAALAAVIAASKGHTVGTSAKLGNPDDIATGLGSGNGVTFACDRYIGKASVQGSGSNARVMGKWDGDGGHQQSVHAVEQHPQFGRIYWVQNNWPGSTYPADPGGGPVCGCWVLESDVEAAFSYNAEVYALSHLNYLPATPVMEKWASLDPWA